METKITVTIWKHSENGARLNVFTDVEIDVRNIKEMRISNGDHFTRKNVWRAFHRQYRLIMNDNDVMRILPGDFYKIKEVLKLIKGKLKVKNKQTIVRHKNTKRRGRQERTAVDWVYDVVLSEIKKETTDAAFKRKYPESCRMKAVMEKSQTIGEFLEWIQEKGKYALCDRQQEPDAVKVISNAFASIHSGYVEKSDDELCSPAWHPTHTRIDQVLAEYFKIDLKKVDQEQRQMLDEIRVANARAKEQEAVAA